MRLSSKDLPPALVRLMSLEDQTLYGGLYGHPRDESVPPMKTDKLERDEQRQFASYCLLHQLPFSWHATNARTKATPGTPDFWCGVRGVGLWIEFKRDYTCHLSKAQEDFARLLKAQGLQLHVVYSCNEAMMLV